MDRTNFFKTVQISHTNKSQFTTNESILDDPITFVLPHLFDPDLLASLREKNHKWPRYDDNRLQTTEKMMRKRQRTILLFMLQTMMIVLHCI